MREQETDTLGGLGVCNPIYTTSVLGTAPLNFGTQAANLRHGTPELCRVNAYLWARVPKNPGGPSTPEIGSLGPPVWSAVPEFEWFSTVSR